MSWEQLIRADLEGLRPYEPGLRASQVRERSGKEHVLKLSSNEFPDGPFPRAVEAIRALAPHLNRYPDGAALALRGALAEKLHVPEREVVVGSGTNEILRQIAQVVLRPGDEVVFAWPSFIVYPIVSSLFGATPIRVDLKDDTHDLDAMLAAVTPRTRIVFLCNPNNPTGTIYRRDGFARFMEEIPPHVLVVADEAYFEFVTDPGFPDALSWYDGERPLVVTRTFSKIYSLAGLRVGWAVMPEKLALAVHKAREPFNVTSPGQIAAYHSLMDDAEVGRRRAENQVQRSAIREAFDRLGVSYAPSEANFVYFKTERPREVFEALLQEGVIVRDFGDSPALRMTVCSPVDTPALIAAFERVKDRLGSI